MVEFLCGILTTDSALDSEHSVGLIQSLSLSDQWRYDICGVIQSNCSTFYIHIYCLTRLECSTIALKLHPPMSYLLCSQTNCSHMWFGVRYLSPSHARVSTWNHSTLSRTQLARRRSFLGSTHSPEGPMPPCTLRDHGPSDRWFVGHACKSQLLCCYLISSVLLCTFTSITHP